MGGNQGAAPGTSRMSDPPLQDLRCRAVLVSDFDGTLARPDFYLLVRERLIPADTPDYWLEYRAGRLTHFEALQRFFAAAEGGEEALIAVTEAMELEPRLSELLSALRQTGWEVIVVSAGCDWYIERLLRIAGIALPVYANPGHVQGGRLIMEPPSHSPFFSPQIGIDKSALVRSLQTSGYRVSFAGDGFSDLEAALLVGERLRFARGDLAYALQTRRAGFRPFRRWSEVAEALMNGSER